MDPPVVDAARDTMRLESEVHATSRIAIDLRVTQGGYPGIGRATEGLITHLLSLPTAHRFLLLYDPARRLSATFSAVVKPPHRLLPVRAAIRSARDQAETPLRLRQARADLYHATYFAMALAPGCRYVVSVFDLIPERYPQYWPGMQARIIRRWLRHASEHAARIFVPSQATASDLHSLYGVARDRLIVTPLAAESRWHGMTVAPRLVPTTRPYLLCVCTNKPHKNLTRLVEAFAVARTRRPNLPDLVWAGGWDPRYPEARQRAVALGVDAAGADRPSVVRFVESPDDATLQSLYDRALAFVFPSEYEGFGLPVLEAMTKGLPVAASRTPAVAEVAGAACLSFDPLDVRSIAEALIRLASDDELRRRLVAAGRERAAAFTWRAGAVRTLAVYDELSRDMHAPVGLQETV